MPAES